MYFITIKRMLEVCFSAHPNIQYRAYFHKYMKEGGTSCFYYNLLSVKCTESEKPSGTI